ncbi:MULTISPECIES: ABC transporter ATP-binding protein [Pseudonocardia]|uniref:ABC-type quaternary amine transporter n=2 Tax=Pseudonocardia TaxID=1847 RepID=A0A1Y2MKM1_PSEAH|nr:MULTISPECIES: ABC transporter ATP-binding protein [Pseudonocardia]OSY35826.1 Spermidine/putrescine import ATP-binding protein PotA [Pseudonocardia autotrophica]TDN73120.1 iron(III) transport system ATP-binding protein [Pseudonocardia autotrophica]BBG03839.1 ABC transporter ATP-binding protein [Pseudonocardia autotrophica]GEC27362.1 ABC transporter ATP-binding protein [Pseudonocardia saturnea]
MRVLLSGLELAYGDVVAVRNLDLEIENGESVVLLGTSGCGKTSTMRCIAGLEEPTGGTITIGDRVVYDHATRRNVPAYKRNVGMVFQSYAVWPHRTVLENVSFPLEIKKLSRAEVRTRAMEVLELVGLGAYAERGASMLSGGQMQRVALARSMAMEPSVLLLDEPLSNLDARLRDDLRMELRRIQVERGLTSMYVTHDQSEALALADRIAIMEGGRITQLATPRELFTAPRTASIARFLGMGNVFGVQSSDASGRHVLAGPGLTVAAEGRPAGTGAHSACFRPEDVVIEPAGSGGAPETNSWNGTVRMSVYQGTTVRCQIELDGGYLVEASCDSETAGSRHAIGEPVRVRVAPERVRILPDEIGADAPAPAMPKAAVA